MTSTRSVLLLLLFQLSFLQIYGQQNKNFFRKDYTYLPDTETFYKIHTIHRTWQDAKKRCKLEGASLFYPEDLKEADAVISFWNQTQPFSFVYIGVSNMLAKEVFQTYDNGRSILDVYNTWAPGEPNDANGEEGCVVLRRDGLLNDERCNKKLPFICKKTLQTLEWNHNCDMPYNDYKFDSHLGRCYKFHLVPKTWSEAFTTCHVEQSYLAVVNTQEEADHLVMITKEAPKEKVKAKHLSGVVYLGFHNRDSEDWSTIQGTSLDDSGYNNWASGQPDGADKEQCGSMFYNGQLNDISCDTKAFFICEHDVSSLSKTFDDRFGD